MGFSLGNTKLGVEISNWSLPAGHTCNGKTKVCAKECFGKKGHYHHPSVTQAHFNNWAATENDLFVPLAIENLTRMGTDLTRIHAVGDFYDASEDSEGQPTGRSPDAYIQDWHAIVTAMPSMYFFAYTRQWRIPTLRKALIRLSRLDNFTLLLSCDKETGRPPKWKHSLWAYMSVSDDDVPKYAVDIVFRAGSRKVPMKHDKGGNLICPYEQGIQRKVKITCASCGICFQQQRKYPMRNSLPVLQSVG